MDSSQLPRTAPRFANIHLQLQKSCCCAAPYLCVFHQGYAFQRGYQGKHLCWNYLGPLPTTHVYDFESNAPLDDLIPVQGLRDYQPTLETDTLSTGDSSLGHQTTSDQNWNNVFNNSLIQDSFPATIAAGLNCYEDFNTVIDGSKFEFSGNFEQAGQDQPDFQLPMLAPEMAVQATNIAPVAMKQTPNVGDAVVLESPDGHFFCSEPGCDSTYLRAGDCRRHLRKHNGPFIPCTQRGCDMEFYRHDKFRAHLKQGHGIIVAAPARGRRPRRTAH